MLRLSLQTAFFALITLACTFRAAGAVQPSASSVPTPLDRTFSGVSLNYTGVLTDLAIDGEGFFILRDPSTEEKFLARTGEFRFDAGGCVVSIHGYRLQGFNSPIRFGETYLEGDPVGDLKADKTILPSGLPPSAASAGILNLSIARDGRIIILLDDGTAYICGQVLLQSVKKMQALVKRWLYLYGVVENDDALAFEGRPGERMLGYVVSGALDASVPATRGISSYFSPLILLDHFRGETELWVPRAQELTVIEATEDLVRWTPIRTNRYGSDSIRLFVKNTSSAGTRYYRAVSPVLRQTGITTDLGISGQGYFIVKDPKTGDQFATRAGHFQLDAQGFLITSQGLRVQGYNLPIDGNQDYPDVSSIGDIRLDKGSLPPRNNLSPAAANAGIVNISIDSTGRINVLLTDGRQYVRGQILLQKFGNPFALAKSENNLYRRIELAGPLSRPGRPLTQELGRIHSGALEFSSEIAW